MTEGGGGWFKDVAKTIGMRVLFYELKKKKNGLCAAEIAISSKYIIAVYPIFKKCGRSV